MRQMKDSGIEWIGEIPAEWEVVKIKHFVSQKAEQNHPDEEVLSLYRDFGVVIKSSRTDNFNRTSENTNNYKFVEAGDLVINKMKTWQGSIAISMYQGIVSPAYYVFKIISSKINNKFLHFLLRSPNYYPEYRRISGGIRPNQWDLDISAFKQIPIVIPPLNEQQCIADYLDAQCARIDETMELVRQSREKLRAYKLSLITEAVTRGLDPDVPMKDSGVPWIGEIPAEWEIKKFATVVSVKANLVSPDNYPNLIQISPENIEKDSGKILHRNTVIESGVRSSNHYFFKGQILYSKIRPSLNKVTIAPFDGLCSADIYPLESKINAEYTVYAMRSEVFLAQVREVTGLRVKMPKINQVELSKIIFCVPPLDEQQRIAAYLDEKCARIDALLAEKDELLGKLAEYKKSLIFECVTGKREVAA